MAVKEKKEIGIVRDFNARVTQKKVDCVFKDMVNKPKILPANI